MKRVFLIVLDSLGIGAAPDAAEFGDIGADTLARISRSSRFCIPTLKQYGIGHIDGLSYLGVDGPLSAAVGRLTERSRGKDTTIGHWELAGHISDRPLPTYPHGFPEEVLAPFRQATGRSVLCNAPASGTAVIEQYGEIHRRTGDLIVYTSADSVFQIAAHEEVVPPETLYTYCRAARKILTGRHGVGRVIARPFIGTPGHYTRTARRHDFSLPPPAVLLPEAVKRAGLRSIGVGKIGDIFADVGLTDSVRTTGNADGLLQTEKWMQTDFTGLCFVNLVDFDMLYGHRQDIDGYAAALSAFDDWLGAHLPLLRPDDVLMITADHGCDPGDTSTDHTREYTPWMLFGPRVRPVNLGTRATFADVAATAAKLLGVPLDTVGVSAARQAVKEKP